MRPTPPPPLPYRRLLAPGAALVAGLLGLGCSTLDVPHAHNHPASSQPKVRAVHHWDVLAADVAERIAASMGDTVLLPAAPTRTADPGEAPPPPVPQKLGALSWRLQPQRPSTFNRAFNALLTHRLVQQGLVLTSESTPAQGSIDYEVQVIEHGSRVSNGSPLAMTQLAAGIAVLRDWTAYSQGPLSAGLTVLTVGALADTSRLLLDGRAAGGPTRTEVLVTTTVKLAGRLHSTTADIYYIDPADLPLYTPVPDPPPPPPPPPPTPMKTWKMVAE
ncbi:hypothetical protein [Hydrogenophaga sp. OTU3427]|uniref:hypothetical protein n=1 Tax=Hydrogenophaga sp. OTU3427 TaxID=3043856 RepID=UPI00313CA83E